MDYKSNTLAIIENSKILTEEDWGVVQGLQEELHDTFLNVQSFRTRTEMEASVLNDLKFPTPDSKYWQSVREQNVMFTELVMLSYEYRIEKVEQKKILRKMETEEDDLEFELLQIALEKSQFVCLQQEKTAKERIREIKAWHEIKERLAPDMKYSMKNVDEHQLISYTIRWVSQFLGLNEHTAIAERNNLIGQLDKGIKLCKERGVLDKVWKEFGDPRIEAHLKNSFKF